ncbi:phenylacetate--CoA ligase family protein [Nocardioides limicola]|uniref:phenylacetate--CoA ligase family protein n=1 Tax=Nocardioides limicola TaxID=2803368 RepID=UPI00193BD3E5|nr:AMP-binding protein [Nocardioides sp. DJM-14]
MNSGEQLADRVAAYRARQLPRAAAVTRMGRAPALDRRLQAAGLATAAATTADAFEAIGVLSKDALPALQQEIGYAGMVGPDADVARVFASPGPIYEPQLAEPDPWRFGPALTACGIGPDDLVVNCFNYHLSPAGMMFDEASRGVGASVLPAGVGMTEIQAKAVADLGVSAYIGLPSYLKLLIDTFAEAHPPSAWRIDKALVTAEPLPTELRAVLRERVSTVLMAYGTAEAGLIGFETEPEAGLRLDEEVYVEICDPDDGRPVPAGDLGEVVVTLLADNAYPLVRFGTGDVSRWVPYGSGEVRLAGVLGRVGAAIKVRGMFVHPHQAASVRHGLTDVGVSGGRFVVETDHGKDRFVFEASLAEGTDEAAAVAAAEARCRGELRIRPEVRIVGAVPDGPVLVDLRG